MSKRTLLLSPQEINLLDIICEAHLKFICGRDYRKLVLFEQLVLRHLNLLQLQKYLLKQKIE